MDHKPNLTVVHSNDLSEFSYSLSLDELRILNLALTKVDSRKSKTGVISIHASEFAEMYDLDRHNVYRNMRNALKEINRKPIKVPYLDDNNKPRVREKTWLTDLDYSTLDDSDEVFIEFNPSIHEYLFELKSNFTSLNFQYVSQLNTPFSFRLYQWLNKARNLNKHQKGSTVEVELNVDWMKTVSGLDDKYNRWGDFKDRVIHPAVNQINSKSDLSVMYEPLKRSRSIYAVRFVYIVEASTPEFSPPTRPRLSRRPKVKSGTHLEGEWMRTNLALLLKYEKDLKTYDPSAKLTMADLKKIAQYSSICSHLTHERITQEIKQRQNKRLSNDKIEMN